MQRLSNSDSETYVFSRRQRLRKGTEAPQRPNLFSIRSEGYGSESGFGSDHLLHLNIRATDYETTGYEAHCEIYGRPRVDACRNGMG
jgi:hypothetical protein